MRFRNGGQCADWVGVEAFVTLTNTRPEHEPNLSYLMAIQCRRLTHIIKAWQIKLNTIHGSTLIYFLFIPY